MTDMTLEERIDEAAARLAYRWTAIVAENVAAEKGWEQAYAVKRLEGAVKRLVGEAPYGDPEKDMAL